MNEKLKSEFITGWTKYFAETPLPIALFYSNTLHNAEPVTKQKGHHCMIADLTRAWHGQSLAFRLETMGCMGGKRYCGFANELRGNFDHFLSYGIPLVVPGERYKKDPVTVNELMKNIPFRQAPAEWLIAKPFDKLEEDDQPEVIVFYATGDVLSGLFTLANYDRTDLYGVKAPFSAGCGSVLHFPMIENEKENPDCILGMSDPSARPYFPAAMMSFAIPMKRFEKLVGYMDESFLITDSWAAVKRRF
jgi:uncharacterized protein (DUF169 family)